MLAMVYKPHVGCHTWPEASGFTDNKTDMLRTLFHFAGEIESSRKNKIRICMSDLILGIESLDIHLSSRKRLLPS
jgi:hypothetical protein